MYNNNNLNQSRTRDDKLTFHRFHVSIEILRWNQHINLFLHPFQQNKQKTLRKNIIINCEPSDRERESRYETEPELQKQNERNPIESSEEDETCDLKKKQNQNPPLPTPPPKKKVRKETEQYAPLEKLLSLSLLRPGGEDCTQEEVRESERQSLKRNEGSKTQRRPKEEREREREREKKEGKKKGRQYFLTLASNASSYFLFSFPPNFILFYFFQDNLVYTFCVKT
jgi:type IV secretory pathway VirB10-like protein